MSDHGLWCRALFLKSAKRNVVNKQFTKLTKNYKKYYQQDKQPNIKIQKAHKLIWKIESMKIHPNSVKLT